MDGFNRWSQIIRRPGQVEIQAHHPIDVPPIGGAGPEAPSRRGIRLIVRPLDGVTPHFTIDVTATAAIAMLEPWLQSGQHVGKVFTWSARGFGARRRDTIRLTPFGQVQIGV